MKNDWTRIRIRTIHEMRNERKKERYVFAAEMWVHSETQVRQFAEINSFGVTVWNWNISCSYQSQRWQTLHCYLIRACRWCHSTHRSAGTLSQTGAHQPATRDPLPFPYPSQRELLLYFLLVFFAVILHYNYLFLPHKYVYSNVILIHDFKKFVKCIVKLNLTLESEFLISAVSGDMRATAIG